MQNVPQVVKIGDAEIPLVSYLNQPVVTFAMIDKVHNRPEGTARKRFSDNRKRFIDGKHFYIVDSKGLSVLRTEFPGVFGVGAPQTALITERGYLLLVKTFSDDLAWQIQEQLIDGYFRAKVAEPVEPNSVPESPAFDKAEFRETLSFMACAKDFAEKVIGLVDSQALLSANQVTFKATGTDVLAYFHHTCIPANPKGLTYNPTELGDLLNPVRSARWINKELAKAGLQVNINGKWEPTDKAKKAGVFEWTDVGKRHHGGMPVKQLRWFKDALEYVVQDRREAA